MTGADGEFACVFRYNLVGRQATWAGRSETCGDFESYSEDTFTLSTDGETLDQVSVASFPLRAGELHLAPRLPLQAHRALRAGRDAPSADSGV